MYIKSLIPQDCIPQKFFELIDTLRDEGKVFVKVAQGENFFLSKKDGECVSTNCWIEISTEPLPLEEKPSWVPAY